MRKFTVLIALLLCLVFLVASFTACGPKKSKKSTEAPANNNTTAVTTTDKWIDLGPEVKAFASEDRSFKVKMSAYTDAEKTSKNQLYLAGPDEETVNSGENISAIEQMVYERNKKANEVLGTSVEYEYWSEYGWGNQAKQINNLIQSETEDAPDVFVFMLYDLNKAMLTVNAFKDIWTIPGSYFDFKADGWMSEWMESLSFTGDRAYILGSDYFIDIFRNMGVVPFNATLMNETASKLAPALFGEGLAESETMSQRFFDYVEAGNWTWDALGKLCEAVHEDNGNDQADFEDPVLGIVAPTWSGMSSSLIIYSAGETLIELTEKDGKQWITYPTSSDALGGIFDAVSGVFKGNGAFAAGQDIPVADHYQKFARNELLFADPSLLGTLEDDVFQQMTSLYSVVPLPKVSADKNYNTVIHNTADVGAINVHTGNDKTKVITAFYEFVTERSAEIREEFLEIVTKYKTTVYNQGTDRLLDLIYDSVITARDKALDDAVDCNGGRAYRFHDMMKNGGYERDSSYVVSEYTSCIDSKQTIVDEILDIWYKLPTYAPEE